MFLKHGAKKVNEIELVAPTGFESVLHEARTCPCACYPGTPERRTDMGRPQWNKSTSGAD